MLGRTSWLLCFLFALLAPFLDGRTSALADETVPKKPKKLRIETLYEPAHCHKKNARKSRKGDELNVVYVHFGTYTFESNN
jgi:hypothetical protein